MLGAAKILGADNPEWIVTQGIQASNQYGFALNIGYSYGSVDPASFAGYTVRELEYFTGASRFRVGLAGNLAQDVFTDVQPEDGNILTSASADGYAYNSTYGYTYWFWNSQTAPAVWDGSGDVWVRMTFP